MGSDGTSPREIPEGMRPAGAFKQVDFGSEGLPDCMLKLVIIGDSGVGKSSCRFTSNAAVHINHPALGGSLLRDCL